MSDGGSAASWPLVGLVAGLVLAAVVAVAVLGGEDEPVGTVTPMTTYSPEIDGEPDPGEVVWAWVPYEDDPAQGKDRPVLVIGREGTALACLYLTSKDHDRDAEDEARWGRHWMDVGTGAWDREGRPSEIRLDRLLTLDESEVRREGAVMARETFDAVVAAARPHWTDADE
ncbi:MAG TPA: type II toxin-antitoxin system PemK/MazF family toxin [Nocardioides sp.]|nr:type II toxin-antitoxin system PemK/MazF family toxin [Nocardioides sp.]